MFQIAPPPPPPQPIEKTFWQKHKSAITILTAIVCALVILNIPIIPTQSTETNVRTLFYGSALFDRNLSGMDFGPDYVGVKNIDSVGGTFSITMKEWSAGFSGGQPTEELIGTSTQSSFISAGDVQKFYVPWSIMPGGIDSPTYAVSAPTVAQDYNVTIYKSPITLLFKL